MTEGLQIKVDKAIKLIKLAARDDVIEVAYSGGKDSDVILELTKMAGVKYRAIYKNTTIDPPYTIKHARDMGAEVLMPRDGLTFFKLIEKHGIPNMFKRFCCKYLKEYKVLDKAVIGIRKSESTKRSKRYSEPTECKFYGSKKEHVEAIYPILEWTGEDVREFISERNIKCAPVYYQNGSFDVNQRLGCLCCPLKSINKRIGQFKKYPNMVKAYVRAAQSFLDKHPNSEVASMYSDVYEWFVRDTFYSSQKKWDAHKSTMFNDKVDYKKFLEDYFGIKFH